jgi:glycosyltransferase involved in cell wall biosynthesis
MPGRNDRGGPPVAAVIINGRAGSASAERARGLFDPLTDLVQPRFFYRRPGRGAAAVSFLRAVLRVRPDLVYLLDVTTPGVAAALGARYLARIPFVLDTGDLAYELAVLKGSPPWPARELIRVVEASALRSASAVVVRGTYHKQLLESEHAFPVTVIRDGISAASAREEDASRLRRDLGLDDSFTVGLVGSLNWNRRYGMCYGWELVEAFGRLDPQLSTRGVVIGDGDGRTHLEARARALGVAHRILFLGRVPYAELGLYLRLLDVAVSTQTNNRVGNVRTTGKLPEYMAAGCYVLASDVGEARLLLPDEMRIRYDGVKDDEYPARLAERVVELANGDRVRLAEATRMTAARAKAELSYPVLSLELRGLLASVLPGATKAQ